MTECDNISEESITMSGDSGKNEKRWGDTTSKRGEASRVFVGNTVPSKMKCSDLGKCV